MTDTTQKPKRGWVKYVLIISLGLNLAVVGMVLGAAFSGGHDRKGFRPPPDVSGMHSLLRALPESKRSDARQYFRDNRAKMKQTGQHLRATALDARSAIVADPFDPAALSQAFAVQRETLGMTAVDAHNAFVSIISTMTLEERKAYVEALNERRMRRAKDRKPPKFKH